MEILRTENLGKRFGEKWVLNDVNLEFYEGEITIISGPNGSGKTTFIKSILGLVVPSKGRILFKGKDVAGESEYRRYLGYMPQIPKFPENLTPKEIFSLMREIYGKDRMEDPQRYIEEFSLRDFWDKPVGTLSGGTRQKMSASLCLSVKAHVYFLDEPNASLDPKSSVVLKEEILRKKSEGASVVIITHIISSFEDIADRLIYFLEGRVKFVGEIESLKRMTGENDLERAIARMEDVEDL